MVLPIAWGELVSRPCRRQAALTMSITAKAEGYDLEESLTQMLPIIRKA
jgi:hypothetical protein